MERFSVKVADEVWIATALLHREHPRQDSFSVSDIVKRVAQEKIAVRVRPGVSVHAYQHCVANRPPKGGNLRMLYALSDGSRRLFRTNDDYEVDREGSKTAPKVEDIPHQYRYLLAWYETEYNRPALMLKDESATYSVQQNGSLFDRIRAIWNEVPDAELRKLPTDGAASHDRYIGGST